MTIFIPTVLFGHTLTPVVGAWMAIWSIPSLLLGAALPPADVQPLAGGGAFTLQCTVTNPDASEQE